jgi:hypothetical protein
MGDGPQLLHRISELLILSPQSPDPLLDAGWRWLPFFWRDRAVGWGHKIVCHAASSTSLSCSFSTPSTHTDKPMNKPLNTSEQGCVRV